MAATLSSVRRSRIRPRKFKNTRRPRSKIRLWRKRPRQRRSRRQRKNRRRRKKLKRRRSDERKSFEQSRSERSEDRHHRRRSRDAGCSRCGGGDARSATIRFREHKNESGSRYVGRKTVAAERNRAGTRRLRCLADLAQRRRRLWAEAARLFQESFEIAPPPRISESAERTHYGRRCFDHRQVWGRGDTNTIFCRSCEEADGRAKGSDRVRRVR